MCVVIDLDVVCLVCLHHSAEMHGIFKCCDEDAIQIAQKISTLSKLKVDANNESLPDKICDSCLKDLKAAWRFHKNCQTAVAVFQSILKPLTQQVQLQPAPQIQENTEELSKEQEEAVENDEQQPAACKNKDQSSADDQSGVSQMAVVEIQDADDHQDVGDLVEKEANDEFLELDQCVVEEVHEDYHSNAEETPEDDLELVEYYLADDALHEHQEETVDNTAETPTIKDEIENTTTIASKKIVMNNTAAAQQEKVWPTVLKKATATTVSGKVPIPRSGGRHTHTQPHPELIKPTVAEHGRSPKLVKRPTRLVHLQRQQTTNKTTEPLELSQQQLTENEDEYEPAVRPVKSSRKRKSRSPDAKPPKICEICGNSYRFQHALNAHMRRHYQDKPFPCEMCDKAFVSNVELRRHMRVHTGHKPYACQYCDRRFSDFGSRIKHERTHTGERPYACNTCGKSFAYPHVLSVHLRTHTGEKKFRCDYCTKGFTKKAYLLSHIEQHHSGRENKEGVVRDVTTYELTMEDDAGADTMEEGDDDLSTMKTVKFNDCIFTTEFVNESTGEVEHINDEDVDSQDDEGPHTIVLQESLLRPKPEADDDDTDIQEVEVHLDEYTIRVR